MFAGPALTPSDSHSLSALTALSPIDGRYGAKVSGLRSYFSEFALIRYRVFVEAQWLLSLASCEALAEVPPFSESAKTFLNDIRMTSLFQMLKRSRLLSAPPIMMSKRWNIF